MTRAQLLATLRQIAQPAGTYASDCPVLDVPGVANVLDMVGHMGSQFIRKCRFYAEPASRENARVNVVMPSDVEGVIRGRLTVTDGQKTVAVPKGKP